MHFGASALQQVLLSSAAVVGLAATAVPAQAGEKLISYNIPAQPLEGALRDFGVQNGMTIMADTALVRGKRTLGFSDRAGPETALRALLKGTGLTYRRDGSVFVVTQAQPQPQPAPSPSASPRPVVAAASEIIVTAQKREESIQDVPIAVTALSNAELDGRKIEGGSELLRAVPNVNFSKSNFSMYNFSIRGIGTKAISASSDPAVAVSFNNTPLVRNRLFEQEFLDLERVEVLRGPQGTLYGRNATAGVVNMISALPTDEFEGSIQGEVGSYATRRLRGMLNVPMGDTLGARIAGQLTKRNGFDYNTFTQEDVNGRDLWSTRATLQWEPSDRFRANIIWQHFEEDDNRSRTGKQLCRTDSGPEMVGDTPVPEAVRGKLSQGCLPGSLYDDSAYGVPNGLSLVYLEVPSTISLGFQSDPSAPRGVGPLVYAVKGGDPFAGVTQSRNLREISTSYDPVFRAKNDVVQLNLEFEPADGLQLVSQTAYSRDRFYSTQDYNRFVTNPVFNDSTQALVNIFGRPIDTTEFPGPTPGGIFCDPQLGCSDRMVSADLSRSRNRQWSQEFRLQSDFGGPLNFNLGANYLDFKSQDDYYVFNNMFTLIADWFYSASGVPRRPTQPPCDLGFEGRECPYVDRNSIENLDNQGHNYFLSQNGIRIKSLGIFGEIYWDIADDLKLTLGARYTRDKKVSDQIPSQLLLAGGTENPFGPEFVGDITGGRVNSGYPALPDIEQKWGEFTGRAVLDWQPVLDFTDKTLVYVSASRGYKGGGTNPPRVDFNPEIVQYQFLPQTFRPEFINAFEIGTKNAFDGGRLTLNASAFFYDYTDYQISQIVDRIAYNENFDATIWGLEFEAAWRPSRAFSLHANLGYLRTRLGDGAQSIDVMNRTQGDPDWVLLRPWLQVPSNCIAPRDFVEQVLAGPENTIALAALCPGATRIGTYNPAVDVRLNRFYERYGFTYDPFAPYNPGTVGLDIADGGSGAPNGGRGFYADLSGNELPNAPRWTINLGAQYTFFLEDDDWELTFRGDYYRQAKSYARVYNTEYDRLKAWDNLNLAVTLERPESQLAFQLYVKNVFNDAPITDFFTNSDDTGLTSNVFTLDPRIIGFSVTKGF
ncbi:TonB-dependent receptor [Altererythrobacter sp. FM1]|uniref:TonB-dependent receptor domain-containing protein n=1 Tax=Tsuneonella flava TaxID=2055955 RepID=UPI000C8034B8|nr:TonB-dependent receptor [Tsuneonella flava]ROT96493.1 TonB-dependent receptor [Altererythrobacter sp. FM1]